jgi:putative ABC transport system permease protein
VLSRMIRSLLFGIAPGDPVGLAIAALALLAVAAAACLVPGLRALRVDPMMALKAE